MYGMLGSIVQWIVQLTVDPGIASLNPKLGT